MARYPYRPELKLPGSWSGIDFSDPRLAPTIRLMVKNLQAEAGSYEPEAGIKVTQIRVPVWDGESIICYVYEPDECKEKLPAMLYCHGGGFFLPIQRMMCRLSEIYARTLHIRVILPEYRILPDHSAPYAFRDCLSIWHWIKTNTDTLKIDDKRVILYGESAGGCVCAGIAQYLRDHKEDLPCGQLLIYPVLDNRSTRYPSVRLYSESAWNLKNNLAMWRNYLKNGDDGLGTYLIPMKTEDLSNLPAAYIEAQEMDILRDEAIAYQKRLQEAGVKTELQLIKGSYHGFDADTENPFVQSVVEQRITFMRHILESSESC